MYEDKHINNLIFKACDNLRLNPEEESDASQVVKFQLSFQVHAITKFKKFHHMIVSSMLSKGQKYKLVKCNTLVGKANR